MSAVGAENEGAGVTTCVAVISEDTSAVPSVNVCQCVILPTTGVWRKMFTARETSGTWRGENHKSFIKFSLMHKT